MSNYSDHISISLRKARSWMRPIPTTALLTVLALTGFAAWLLRVDSDSRQHEIRRRKVLQVSMALVNYSEAHGHLPHLVVRQELAGRVNMASPSSAVGPPLYSWRVEIVPFLEAWHGRWDPSRPWDSPANAQLMELSPFYTFRCDAREGLARTFPETNLLAITGPDTAFGEVHDRPKALNDVPPSAVLVLETRSSGIPWPAPGDFDLRTMPRTASTGDGDGVSSREAAGVHVIFADGQVWLLSEKVPFENLKKFFTTKDAATHDREVLLGPFAVHRGP